jgi:hypothetical protein
MDPSGSSGAWPDTKARPGSWAGHSRTHGKGRAIPGGVSIGAGRTRPRAARRSSMRMSPILPARRGLRGYVHSRAVARRAPSARAANLAHTIFGWISGV